MTKTKIVCTRWEDNEVKNNAMLSNLISLDLDGPVNRINAEFARLPHIAKISYSNLNEKKNTAMYGLSTISGYVTKIIDYIDEYIDDPFYKKLNGPTGVLERLEKIRLDDSKYQVKNTAGIETEKTVYITDPYTHQTKAEVVKEVKNKISIEDMLKTSGVKGSSSIPTFKDLYKEQFDQQSKANPDLKYSEYVDQLIHRADISHSVDAGWLNVVSDVLDIVGIVSIVGIFTGKDFITGEIYTKAERDAALINGIISIGSLAFAGVGLVGSGLKATAVGLGKAVALDMAAGAAGMGAGAVAGALGAPDELRALITIGTAMGAGYGLGKITNKNINKVVKDSGTVGSGSVYDDLDEMLTGSLDGKVKYNKIELSDNVNDFWKNKGYSEPPYNAGDVVIDGTLTKDGTFVRVYDGVNTKLEGGFVMKAEDIKNLTPAEIQAKYALPYEPVYVAEVKLDAGTNIHIGEVAPNFGYSGGGIQIDMKGAWVGEFKELGKIIDWR
ncbi:hypothetical protein EDD63_12613 [Breznakia blatticola]|uniref:Uncharacterized protein n=1 Tax=Breznakia blatticola TaxID=1754012 RepID=A0A4R7ZF67_9FIRM|nr:hypothetical protein [Breznakia blatticola]TDW16249.1 hypothetical protein EDD63_12613 [Breznakia blatticola]